MKTPHSERVKRAREICLVIPLLAAVLVVSGCGYKLRGALDLPESIRKVHVMAPPDLRNDILVLLESGDIDATATRPEADASITVTSEQFSRRVLSVDPTTGKEREFELAYTLAFAVTRGDGTRIIEDGSVNLLRDYVFDPEAVIGTSREEDLLRDEMRRDAARQLMRRVGAALNP